MTDDPKSSPAKQIVKATQENFGLVFNAVMGVQLEVGKQSKLCETLDRHYMEQREDIRTLEKIIEAQGLEFKNAIKSLNRTMYLGWALLLAIGAAVIWMVLRVWEILLPFLQLKLGLPTK